MSRNYYDYKVSTATAQQISAPQPPKMNVVDPILRGAGSGALVSYQALFNKG